jgi:hypothetical protein
MKRTIVQEGRRTGDGETPSGAATPVTQEASGQPSENPQTIEGERRISDPEKGFHESKCGILGVKDRKDEIIQGRVCQEGRFFVT